MAKKIPVIKTTVNFAEKYEPSIELQVKWEQRKSPFVEVTGQVQISDWGNLTGLPSAEEINTLSKVKQKCWHTQGYA